MLNIEVLPEEVRNSLRFQLENKLVENESVFESEVQRIIAIIKELAEYDGKLRTSARFCLEYFEKYETLSTILDKLSIYRTLDESIDTRKTGTASAFYSRISPYFTQLVFADLELQEIDENTWNKWCEELPKLRLYSDYMRKLWRVKPHTLSRKEEELLTRLTPLLTQWQKDLYQQLVLRAKFEEFDVDGKKLHSMRDYSILMLHKDRSLRERAWKAYFQGYSTQRDLFAFALYRVAVTNNTKAQLSNFQDALEKQAFYLEFTPRQVENLWVGVEKMTPLLRRYQLADLERKQKILQLSEVEPWDMEQEGQQFDPPLYPALQAFDYITEALNLLGDKVVTELKNLLNPQSGRVDMYGGPYRRPGAFSINSGSFPGFFYLDQYHGTFDQVRTIAHEAGHTVHHTLMAQKGLPSYTNHGPSYVTETAAMTFEEILNQFLLDHETDEKTKDYLWRKQLSDLMTTPRIGWVAKFEASIYQKALEQEFSGKGPLQPDEWDELAVPAVSALSIFYPKYKEPLAIWQRIHHYYTVPLYNLNYLISKLLTYEITSRLFQDPSFAKSITELFSHPFDRPPYQIILNTVGIDFNRDDWFNQALVQMEKQVAHFEVYVRSM
ncbi:MAG: M3 family metallopeptidase [bacterium]|nr:M3 family metallopeptidase [bacterium]